MTSSWGSLRTACFQFPACCVCVVHGATCGPRDRPGGCVADDYDWRDGIGDPAQRPVRLDKAWGEALFEADQADRTLAPGKPIDWSPVQLYDEARQLRVKALLEAGSRQSGADYFHAAMVFQHAFKPDDFLLARDLCVIAISKGEMRAKWLAAASLDHLLVRLATPAQWNAVRIQACIKIPNAVSRRRRHSRSNPSRVGRAHGRGQGNRGQDGQRF